MCDGKWPADLLASILEHSDCRAAINMCTTSHACLKKCAQIFSGDPNPNQVIDESDERHVRQKMIWTCLMTMINELLQEPPPIGHAWQADLIPEHSATASKRNIANLLDPDSFGSLQRLVAAKFEEIGYDTNTITLAPEDYPLLASLQQVVQPYDYFYDANADDIAWVAIPPAHVSVGWYDLSPENLIYVHIRSRGSEKLLNLLVLAFRLRKAEVETHARNDDTYTIEVTLPTLPTTEHTGKAGLMQKRLNRQAWLLQFPFLKEPNIDEIAEKYEARTFEASNFVRAMRRRP